MSSFVLTIGFSSSITFLFSSSDRSLTVWCFTHKMYHHSSYFLTTSGCMLCLGRANYFRFNHPEQAMRLRGTGPLSPRSEDAEAATHPNSTNGGEFLITKFSFSFFFMFRKYMPLSFILLGYDMISGSLLVTFTIFIM